MKKLISVMMTLCLMLTALTGCGQEKKDGTLKVAVVQQLEHRSMDEIREAAVAGLADSAEEKGLQVESELFNGQNDPTILGQIGAQVKSDGFDAVLPIGTLAAQCMISATEGTEIPVIYAAISDPEEAGVVGLPNVTGTSDALDTEMYVKMMLAMNPELKTVGLLYSNSEPNSKKPVSEIKAILADRGIEVLEKTGHTADEVVSAAGALVGRVDAVFTPTDNAVMNVAASVSELFAKNQIPFYAGADSFVEEGALASCGVNYQELGRETARMAAELLAGGACPDYKKMQGGAIAVNTTTADALGFDPALFSQMAGQVTQYQ